MSIIWLLVGIGIGDTCIRGRLWHYHLTTNSRLLCKLDTVRIWYNWRLRLVKDNWHRLVKSLVCNWLIRRLSVIISTLIIFYWMTIINCLPLQCFESLDFQKNIFIWSTRLNICLFEISKFLAYQVFLIFRVFHVFLRSAITCQIKFNLLFRLRIWWN